MKRNKMIKLLTAALMFVVMLTPVLGGSLAAHAANEPAGTGQPDTTSERSLTIWKYEIDNMSQAGDRGDGTFTPDPNRTPLQGVQFRITRVESVDNGSLINPLTQEGQWVTVGTPIYLVTDGDGRAHHSFGVGNANDGIYLVEEIINPALMDQTVTRAVDPFFVQLPMTRRAGEGAGSEFIYEVHVHPKNVVTTPLDPEKTIRGNDALYGEGAFFDSWNAGTPFWWDLTTNVPRDLVRGITEPGTFTRTTLVAPYVETVTVTREMIEASDFFVEGPAGSVRAYPLTAVNLEIRDILDSSLLINDYQMWAYQEDLAGGPGVWLQLQEEVHFVMSMDSENDVTFSLTDEGMIFIHGDFSRLRVSINVESQEDFNGVMINTFDVRYLGPDWEIAADEETSNQAVYFTGGYNFIKLSRASGLALEGAIFHIAVSQEDAAAGRFLASDGNSYLYTDSLPMGVTFLVAQSDEDGWFGFNGLPLNANGFAVPVNETLLEELWRDFFVVETTAPIYTDAEGRVFTYELLGAPIEVRVTPFTHLLEGEDARAVYNDRSTDLPFTGGMGTAFLVILAIIVIGIGTTAFVVDRKRRNGSVA